MYLKNSINMQQLPTKLELLELHTSKASLKYLAKYASRVIGHCCYSSKDSGLIY